MNNKYLIIVLLLICTSCTKKNNVDKILNSQTTANHKEEKIKEVRIPDLPLIKKSDLNTIIKSHLIKENTITKIDSINKNTRFLIKGYESEANDLYFNTIIPIKGGQYVNDGLFIIYDLVYKNSIETNRAYENLLIELKKIESQYKYFDYMKGASYVFFLDVKSNKITIITFSGVSGLNEGEIIQNFIKKYIDKFDSIIIANSTGFLLK